MEKNEIKVHGVIYKLLDATEPNKNFICSYCIENDIINYPRIFILLDGNSDSPELIWGCDECNNCNKVGGVYSVSKYVN